MMEITIKVYSLAMPFVDSLDVTEYHAVAAVAQALGQARLSVRILHTKLS